MLLWETSYGQKQIFYISIYISGGGHRSVFCLRFYLQMFICTSHPPFSKLSVCVWQPGVYLSDFFPHILKIRLFFQEIGGKSHLIITECHKTEPRENTPYLPGRPHLM